MKTKIVGILVSMLLIATILVSAVNVNKKNTTPILSNMDVPIWEVGDSWTYEIEKTIRSDINETMKYFLTGDIDLTVMDDSGDHYTLEGVGESITILGNIGSLVLRSSRIITVSIDMVVRKTDLAVSSFNFMFKGIAFIALGPIIIPIPFQLHEWRDSVFTPDRPVLPFPLHDGKNGTFDSVSVNEKYALTMFWGLIELDSGDDTWSTGSPDFTCTADQVTVPAGTFDVYLVHVQEYANYIYLYYNETVGSIVKLTNRQYSGEFHDWWLFQTLKLKSTTYTP